MRAAHNKSHRLCPQLADNIQSDCLQGHAASRSALHHGWIDPSLRVSPFLPLTLTLWYPLYILCPCSLSPFRFQIDFIFNIVFPWRRANEKQ